MGIRYKVKHEPRDHPAEIGKDHQATKHLASAK
jgi:hypothetical protein